MSWLSPLPSQIFVSACIFLVVDVILCDNWAAHCSLALAVRAYSDAIELDSKNVKALFGRAAAYEAMGSSTEFDLAIKDMKAAAEVEPKHLKKYRAALEN